MAIKGIDGGFFPVYWEVVKDYNLATEEVNFFHYLAETFPIWEDSMTIDGLVYKRLSDSRIQQVMRTRVGNELKAISNPTINKYLKVLEDNNYIKTWCPYNKGPRYYTILLDVENPVESGYYSGKSNGKKESKKRSKKSLLTKETINTINTIETKDIGESNNSLNIEDSSKNLRDIYTVINAVDMPEDVKDEFKNFFANKVGQYTVKQVNDNIDDIYMQCNGNWEDVKNSVHQAYLSNWGKFYFRNSSTSTVKKSAKDVSISEKEDPNNICEEGF